MKKRNIVVLGLLLFSLFFGAGNLIFPPFLGMQAGENFVIAIIGFILTAVFIPFLAVLAVSISDNGLLEIGQRVHPIFGLIFSIIIYLSIGALYGIPRAASVAYELGFIQVFQFDNKFSLLIFSIIFFAITYFLSVDARKMLDNIGKVLTPALLIVLIILFIRAFTVLQYDGKTATEKFQDTPFLAGFLEGYFTMDAIAALAFGIVIVNGLKLMGVKHKQELIKGTAQAGIIAAVFLTIVYLSLSWIGRVLTYDVPVKNGAEILVYASNLLFVNIGSVLFGMIVLLACLTTCVGLINACASFFSEVFPKVSFKVFVISFVLIGLLITNLGLNTILAIATPILIFIYPFAIVLILLSCFQYFLGESQKMYVYTISVTAVFASLAVLDFFKVKIDMIENVMQHLPLYLEGLGWVLPAFIVAMLGYVIDKITGNMKNNKTSM